MLILLGVIGFSAINSDQMVHWKDTRQDLLLMASLNKLGLIVMKHSARLLNRLLYEKF